MLAFRGSCGHDLRVPDELAGRPVRCPVCETVLTAPEVIPYAQPAAPPVTTPRVLLEVERRRAAHLKRAYLVALVAGLVAVVSIYLVFFDSLSEEQLVTLTPFWAFPLAFGFYGYTSQRLIRYIDEGRAASMYEAAKTVVDYAGKWAVLPLLPFLALRWRSSLLVTFVAAVVLAGFLWAFFALVFPGL